MREQMQLVARSVEVSEQIATMLARYNTDAVRALLHSPDGEALPEGMLGAYRELLFNLC
eukprot:gene7174-22307_t